MTVTIPSGGVQQTEKLMTGTQAVAQAVRLADVDVTAAYPIRPYDGVMQAVAKLIANGELDAEYIVAEGEHSQFEICKHASAVGSRVFVGSSGVGWMYAMESLAVTPTLRLPVVAMIGNRALDDPGAFGVEHNDAMCVRDLGWQLFWVEDAQECFDATLRRSSRSLTRRASTRSCRPTIWETGCSIQTTPSPSPPRRTRTGSWRSASRQTRLRGG
jgi:pyruvate ferredoxin oxidoreductase alpha subunit